VGDGRSFCEFGPCTVREGEGKPAGAEARVILLRIMARLKAVPLHGTVYFRKLWKSGPDTNLMAVIRSCHFHAKIEAWKGTTSSPELKPQIIQDGCGSRSLIVQAYALVLLPLLVRGGLFGYAHRGAGGGGCER